MHKQEDSFQPFSLSERTIEKEIKITRRTLRAEKEYLRNIGLIKFQTERGSSTMFTIETNFGTNQKKQDNHFNTKFEIPKITKPSKPIESKPTNESPKRAEASQSTLNGIPNEAEFLAYAKTLSIYKPSEIMDFRIKAKYKEWLDNGWKNSYGNKIKNWKLSIQNSIPYWVGNYSTETKIPTISRPKKTYNE